MAEFERVRLQSVVRRLRTIDCKLTPSTFVMCAFAPLKLTCSEIDPEFPEPPLPLTSKISISSKQHVEHLQRTP